MIDNYALFYSYKSNGDVLSILLDSDVESTNFIRHNNVVTIYHNEDIIGYNIFEISKIMKIKSDGLIALPSHLFIDIINSILKNAKAEQLSYIDESGFVIGKIISSKEVNNKYINLIDISSRNVCALSSQVLKANDTLVVAKAGAFLPCGRKIKMDSFEGVDIDAYIVKEDELGLSEENKIIFIDDDVEVGSDFFQMEEKTND